MAEYHSKHAGLMFIVDGEGKRFHGGRYVTEDPKEIAVLDALHEAERVDEPAAKPAKKSDK